MLPVLDTVRPLRLALAVAIGNINTNTKQKKISSNLPGCPSLTDSEVKRKVVSSDMLGVDGGVLRFEDGISCCVKANVR